MCMPKMLTDVSILYTDQKVLQHFENEADYFFLDLITGDETWISSQM